MPTYEQHMTLTFVRVCVCVCLCVCVCVLQHMDEIWRDVRWLTDALQYARYKQPVGGVSISCLLDLAEEATAHKSDSTSSNTDYDPTALP